MRQSLTERVAFAIQVEMLRQGISTTELATRMDVQYLWLHRRLKGITPFLLEDVGRAADALGVKLTQLVDAEAAA